MQGVLVKKTLVSLVTDKINKGKVEKQTLVLF